MLSYSSLASTIPIDLFLTKFCVEVSTGSASTGTGVSKASLLYLIELKSLRSRLRARFCAETRRVSFATDWIAISQLSVLEASSLLCSQ